MTTVEQIMDDIERIRGTIPPMPFLVSSTMFNKDNGVQFRFKCRVHVGAHPDMWAKLPVSPYLGFNFSDVPIIDIDDEQNEHRRSEFFMAMSIISASGAGEIEDAIATAIERGYRA